VSRSNPSEVRYRHYLRKFVHMGLGALALSIRFIPREWTLAALGFAALTAWIIRPYWPVVMPMARATELRDGVMWGVRYYFGTLFLLAVFFGHRPEILTASWFVLALGDGLSATIGGPGSAPVPWNRTKRLYGTLACFAGSAAALILARLWFLYPPDLEGILVAAAIGLAVSVLESLRTPLDDNLLVGFGTALLCSWTGFFY